MPAKTSQLQIRVTEAEKASLKRLADAAGMSVSRYVLRQALPARDLQLTRAMEGLAGSGSRPRAALEELADLVFTTPPEDFAETLAAPPPEQLSPTVRNQIAAMVEQAAHLKSVDPPAWVDEVEPLAQPHFGWPLSSLRPHQIRVTPVPFKIRGLFFDPASARGLSVGRHTALPADPAATSDAVARLRQLGQDFLLSELKVEFYFLGGAVLLQGFHARPPTARISALFEPAGTVTEAIARVRRREGWPDDWLTEAVRNVLTGGSHGNRYVELPGLAVFVPRPEYVLALKVAALRVRQGPRRLDDLRYVIRALNLTDIEGVLKITARYFSARQLAPDTRSTLEGLLAG